jgi:alpha-D-ribose 1-methylphosphonate 5-triphosphate synthase subunit PhnG
MAELTEWGVTVAAAATEPHPDTDPDPAGSALRLSDLLADSGAQGAATSMSGDRVEATFTIQAEGPAQAVQKGLAAWREAAEKLGFKVSVWPVTRAEAATYDELAADFAATALPELVGVAEVAEMLGVSKQRVSALKDEPWFPRPLAQLASGPAWSAAGIRKFASEQWHEQDVGLMRALRTARKVLAGPLLILSGIAAGMVLAAGLRRGGTGRRAGGKRLARAVNRLVDVALALGVGYLAGRNTTSVRHSSAQQAAKAQEHKDRDRVAEAQERAEAAKETVVAGATTSASAPIGRRGAGYDA